MPNLESYFKQFHKSCGYSEHEIGDVHDLKRWSECIEDFRCFEASIFIYRRFAFSGAILLSSNQYLHKYLFLVPWKDMQILKPCAQQLRQRGFLLVCCLPVFVWHCVFAGLWISQCWWGTWSSWLMNQAGCLCSMLSAHSSH